MKQNVLKEKTVPASCFWKLSSIYGRIEGGKNLPSQLVAILPKATAFLGYSSASSYQWPY